MAFGYMPTFLFIALWGSAGAGWVLERFGASGAGTLSRRRRLPIAAFVVLLLVTTGMAAAGHGPRKRGYDTALRYSEAIYRSLPEGSVLISGIFWFLGAYLQHVEKDQHASTAAVQDLLSGRNEDILPVVSAVAKADLSFKLLVGVRNKVIEAYKQTMNMQV